MRVDDLAAYDQSEPIANPLDQTNLFTVKIVHAEGLSMDNGKMPDSFVIISDRHGNRYAKTRTIFEDTDPQWGETFDVAVRGETWFMATIRHRTLSGKHELLGRAYLRLNPSSYVDLITKDTLLPLDTRGHLMLRVSMEGERDDIQFHFGRAFRWLKRTESDMVRTFVDKMTPVLRHTLSRSSIKSVLKPASNPLQLDYNDALAKLSTAYRSAMGTPEYTIPAVPESAKVGKRGLSDAEIEVAIGPLFDYLDVNNHTLSATLSHEAMQMVMAKLWKQILMTIEGLIVPPLSDKPSHMRALSDSELDIALKWLNFLRDFFYLNGDPRGVPLNVLQNQKYNEIMSVRMYYDWATDDLMEVSSGASNRFMGSRSGMHPRVSIDIEASSNDPDAQDPQVATEFGDDQSAQICQAEHGQDCQQHRDDHADPPDAVSYVERELVADLKNGDAGIPCATD